MVEALEIALRARSDGVREGSAIKSWTCPSLPRFMGLVAGKGPTLSLLSLLHHNAGFMHCKSDRGQIPLFCQILLLRSHVYSS
jgi:hypothetical protein